MKLHLTLLLITSLCLCFACKKKTEIPEREASMSSIFEKKKTHSEDYDLASILKGGELIIATISSPETYYDYHGVGMGLQYALAENFADSQGLQVRVEVAADTTELVKLLVDGTADVIAYPLSPSTIEKEGLLATGYNKQGNWAVRPNSRELAQAMNDWYGDGVEIDVNKALEERIKRSNHIERKAQAVFLSRELGVISVYDDLFKNASTVTGWDWKLIAAMSYQESAFDPNARSGVGAQGLMQLMPQTAKSLGLEEHEICNPDKNVGAAARYINQLNTSFTDIKNREERTKFILGAYNGGIGHIRDAMALARKYNRNPFVWDEVAPYVLGLSQPQYYKDRVVKRGYMRGSETANYVLRIMERWRDYGGNVVVSGPPKMATDAPTHGAGALQSSTIQANPASEIEQRMNATSTTPAGPTHNTRPNRYTTTTKVLAPDDPNFNQMKQ